MKILAIETSCDETSIAIVECEGDISAPKIKVLGHALFSQVETHAKYGGVYPNLAKREHQINFTPLLISALEQAKLLKNSTQNIDQNSVSSLLEREPEAAQALIDFLCTHDKPKIDAIAVTVGPGLEPTLWVGIQCAEAIARTWNLPLFGINHMEGHIFSVIAGGQKLEFPILALLVSGGHTQLIKSDIAGKYKIARILGLPYPGGPQISKLATEAREKNISKVFSFPRPMIQTPDLDFSFSGLKTHVLYALQKHGELTEEERFDAAREAEDAIIDVLIAKTRRAIENYPETKTLIVAGGVASNNLLRTRMNDLGVELNLPTLFPTKELSTDNAIMIGIVCYIRSLLGDKGRDPSTFLKANGRLSL
jgi:N6-L-threonylcarbamoyladenine synthase